MIKTINGGAGITVNNTYSTWPSFYNSISSTGNNLIGQMRYNGGAQCIEVYDGNSWVMLTTQYPTVELAPHVQAVVDWAQTKMVEEERIKKLAAQHPTVADALLARDRAEDAVKIAAALCKV